MDGGIVDYLTTGHVYEHWSRVVASSFFFSIAMVLSVTRLVGYALDLLAQRMAHLRSHEKR